MTTEEALVIFVGDDWAEDHHDVHLMDESGARLASRRLPEGLAGIGEFHQLLARHAEEPDRGVIGSDPQPTGGFDPGHEPLPFLAMPGQELMELADAGKPLR